MGDRVSISFSDGKDNSVVLFSHWDGMSFVEQAEDYAGALARERGDEYTMPLDRLEPSTVMVDFIRYLTKDFTGRVESDLYLGATPKDGDNSDNDHYTITLEKGVGVRIERIDPWA